MLLRLEDMTVEQKIGFVLCARRFEEDDIDFTLELIKNKALGCVQAPAEKPELVKKLLDANSRSFLCRSLEALYFF